MLSVTNIGLAAITRADEGGFLVNLGSFKVSEQDISGLTDLDLILATDLLGNPVYSAEVTSIEAVDTSVIRLTLTIPVSYPPSGFWTLREVGIYLETGELFAVGKLDPEYVKTNEYAVKLYVLVVANRLGDLINVVISQNNSLPSTPFVRTLVSPQQSPQNTVAVLDESLNDYEHASSAGLAVKSGPGGLHWAFLGYNRVYKGAADSIGSLSSFVVSPKTGGFWLNDGEVVVAQIVSGAGAGVSRKLTYDKKTDTFTVIDKPWLKLGVTSVFAIWRNLKDQLPSRADIPEYMMLGVGINSWKRTVQANTKQKYVAKFVAGVLDSGKALVNASLVGATKETTYVFMGGRCLNMNEFLVAGNKIVVSGAPVGTAVEVQAFVPEDSQVGGLLVKYDTAFQPDGQTTRFYMPIVPDDGAWVSLFHNNIYISKTKYAFDDTSIVFLNAPSAGDLVFSMFATYEDEVSSTDFKRFNVQAVQGSEFQIPIDFAGIRQDRVVVYVDGKNYSTSEFSVSDAGLKLIKQPLWTNGVANLDVSVFEVKDTQVTSSATGVNTGPIWADPAGRFGPPNKLVPKISAYVSDGSQTVFSVFEVPRKNNIVMIAGGSFQDPRTYSYDAATVQIVLSQPIPFGVSVDFICFTDVEDAGTAAQCEVFDFTTTSSLSYAVNPVGALDSVILVIGGAYQHKGSFYVDATNQLILQGVVAGEQAELWYFKTTGHPGWRTEVFVDFNEIDSTNSYLLENKVSRKENTLVFLSSVLQYKPVYSVQDENYIETVKFGTPAPAGYYTHPLITVSFISGPPLTRLMLREDANTKYMPRHGPYVGWPNLTTDLRNMLACPMTKLLALLTGSMKQDFNNGSANDAALAEKYGLQPVTKNLTMSVLPTASYAGIGTGATLGAKMTFNVYKYLELFLKAELGSNTFTIHTYEQGVKYFIDNIQLGAMSYSAVARESIPMISYSTGIYINYPNALTGVTYAGVPLLTNFFDMMWSNSNSVLPAGFTASNTTIHTSSVVAIDDDNTQSRTFTHVIVNGFNGQTYTVKWKRPYTVTAYNTEYMVLVDGGGAPGYVQYFARLYAQWKYSDADITKCMYYNKVPLSGWAGFDPSGRSDAVWPKWLVAVQGGATGGNYPAIAGYTAGLAFGVVVDNFNANTGNCDVVIKMLSGTIGYSYFPAEMLIKKIEIPVSYTMYPAIAVDPITHSVIPMVSNDDLFKSCCWTGFEPSSTLGCGGDVATALPTVATQITTDQRPVIVGTYPKADAKSLSVKVAGTTFVLGSSSALTAIDNEWTLVLASTPVVLSPGYYDVEVSVDVGTGTPLIDKGVNEITITAGLDTRPPATPVVTAKIYNTTHPVINGTYASADSAGGFVVVVNGWSYNINGTTTIKVGSAVGELLVSRPCSSAPLTAVGDNWSLDLGKDTGNILAYGNSYNVVATSRDASGNTSNDTTNNEIAIYKPSGTVNSTYCVGLDKWGVLENGAGATYNQLIEANSVDCGWSPVVRFPNTGGALSTNYDFSLGGPYQSLTPLRVYLSRNGSTGSVTYSVTSYTTYCGDNPTFTGTAVLGTMSDSGKDVEYFNVTASWRKGCCNGNDNNIYVTVRISMTAAGNIKATLISSSTDGQWGC